MTWVVEVFHDNEPCSAPLRLSRFSFAEEELAWTFANAAALSVSVELVKVYRCELLAEGVGS